MRATHITAGHPLYAKSTDLSYSYLEKTFRATSSSLFRQVSGDHGLAEWTQKVKHPPRTPPAGKPVLA